MGLKRRELISGALALATVLLTGVPASSKDFSLGRSTSIKVGGAKIFSVSGSRVLVFRSTTSRFSAFIANCPDDSTNLSGFRAGKISCPTDKTVFSALTGKRLSGPSTQSLKRVPIKISKGFLIATLLPAAMPAPSASSAAEELISTSKVPIGGGVKVTSSRGEIMVVQASAGKFAAFSTICNHGGCAVSKVNSTSIICECHGSEFSTMDGSVSRGPATQALKQYSVIERNGFVILQ